VTDVTDDNSFSQTFLIVRVGESFGKTAVHPSHPSQMGPRVDIAPRACGGSVPVAEKGR
jgi:hypothetical protein